MFRPSRALPWAGFLALAAVSLVVTSSAAAGFQKQVVLQAESLHIADLIGEVQITGTDGPSYEVLVSVAGADARPDRIRIEEKRGDDAELRVVFPLRKNTRYVYPRLGDSSTTFTPNTARGDAPWWKKVWGVLGNRRVHVSGHGRGLEVWADVTVKVPRGRKLVLDLGVGSVHAENTDGDLVLSTRTGPVTIASANGDIVAGTGSGRVRVTGAEGRIVADTGSGDVFVSDVDGAVVADTGSGDVTVKDVNGPVTADTGSGSVQVTRGRGSVAADTGSGGVKARGIVGSLTVDTGTGDVLVDGCRGKEILVDTGSGGIVLRDVHCENLSADTGSGSISLDLPRDVSARIHASPGGGTVFVDFEQENVHRRSRDDLDFQVGDGETRVNLDTGSGTIRITG